MQSLLLLPRVRWSEGARKTFASGHVEEGQTTSCAEKSYNCTEGRKVQRVEKYGKYGLYDNNGAPYCKPCGKKMDETREDSLTKHVTSGIHDTACAKHIPQEVCTHSAEVPWGLAGVGCSLHGK